MKTIRIISVLLLFLVGLNAVVAGYALMNDTSGSDLGISVLMLKHSPFSNFLIPGIVLFSVNGVFNIVAAVLSAFQWNRYQQLIVFQGVFLVIWIILQVIFLQQISFLHFVVAGIGLLLFMFGNRLNV